MTAWRLLKSGNFQTLLIRTFRLLIRSSVKNSQVNYTNWRKKWVELNAEERIVIEKLLESLSDRQSFTLFLSADKTDPDALFSTVKSICSQLYPDWVLHVISGKPLDHNFSEKVADLCDSRIVLKDSSPLELGDWVIELAPGTLLEETALLSYAVSIIGNPEIQIVYCDHDHVNIFGNFCDPYMKPDWNPDLFAAMNYFGPLVACKKELWEIHKEGKNDQHDFFSAVTKNLSQVSICHVPHVLASVQITENDSHLEPPCKRIIYDLPSPAPMVSIIIPSRDQGRMLKRCLESLFRETSYSNFEVVLVDHETSEPEALRVIEEFKSKDNFRVMDFSGSFNFAAIMNRAAEVADGQVLVLLNNDTEIVDSEWLTELVGQVSRPDVGVVGSLLLFGDGTIQHAGVHPGVGGLMGHGHKHLSGDDIGYFNRLKAVHEVAAVTGACLAVEKSIWVDLSGLDELNLPVAYNDIDLCLKARENGLKVVFTPFSKVVHHESVSRGVDDDPSRNVRLRSEVNFMVEKWGELLESDPAYSPNLSLDGGTFKLAELPRVLPFWKNN